MRNMVCCSRKGAVGARRVHGQQARKRGQASLAVPQLPEYGFSQRLIGLRAEVLSLLSQGHRIDQEQAQEVQASVSLCSVPAVLLHLQSA